MKRIVSILLAAGVLATGAAAGAADAPLDIVGIKVGMSVADALGAFKANNPRMGLMPTTVGFEGFSSPLTFGAVGNEDATSAPDSSIARAGEQIEMLFTTQPQPPVVWAVQRNYHFATKEQPAVEAALAALLKKYGAPSKPPTTDPRDRNQYIIWVYDAQGRALGAGGAALARQCDSMFSAHFGTDQTSINEIETGRPGPNSAKECDSVAVVAASVQTVIATPGSAQLAVNNLIVWMADGARHRASVDATRAVVAAAAKARDNKSTEELQKRGAPKL